MCRVKKFPSLNLQHLLLRETTLLLVRIVILFRKLSVIYLVWTLLKNLLVSPVSLTHFQFLPVVQESKGSFWIFDNQFIYRQKFKLKDLGVATQLFDCYYYLFKFDFKSGYHIDIFPGHRKFLTFVWDFGNWISNTFSVLCDPFRALHIFTSILRPLQKLWRGQGILKAIFLMMVWEGQQILSLLKLTVLVVRSDLLKSGFFPNEEKSL